MTGEDGCILPREGHHGTIKKGSLYNNATMYARWEWNQALPKPYLHNNKKLGRHALERRGHVSMGRYGKEKKELTCARVSPMNWEMSLNSPAPEAAVGVETRRA